MDNLKVLHVIASMDPQTGGVCQAVRTMVNSLGTLDVYNEVASLDKPGSDFLAADPFILHPLGPSKGPWAFGAKLKLWLLENIGRFDAVIVHGLWLYPSYITFKCLSQLKKKTPSIKTKLYIMPHGMLDPYFQKASGRKIKALRNQIFWKLIESAVVNKSDGLLFTCEEEKLLARKPFTPYRPKNEIVVGLGVDEPPAYTGGMYDAFFKKCPGAENSHYLLFLGRIHEKKGVDLLVKAFIGKLAEWKADGKKSLNVKLVIAGPGMESAFGEEVLKLINSHPDATGNILLPGMLEGNAKWGAFYNCSAFILPSHQENFGIAVVEALACGKPVLISDQVNIWREIKNEGAGVVAADTESGTYKLLTEWESLSAFGKLPLMGEKATDCYNRQFATGSSAKRLFNTLNNS